MKDPTALGLMTSCQGIMISELEFASGLQMRISINLEGFSPEQIAEMLRDMMNESGISDVKDAYPEEHVNAVLTK